MFFVNKSIVCNLISTPDLPMDIESLFLELNLRNQKVLLVGAYRPPSQDARYFLRHLAQQISLIGYDEVIILGDFNLPDSSEHFNGLKAELDIQNLVHEPTCFKSPTNPSCIDHIWVTKKKRFIRTSTFDIGLSDFHRMTVTIFNTQLPKSEPKYITYRDYRKFDSTAFKNQLKLVMEADNMTYEKFDTEFKTLLNSHAPLRKKTIRSNDAPFMSKRLRKEIMFRSRKRNLFHKDPTTDNWNKFRIQRNKCTRLIRDAKRKYYQSLNLKILKDNKKFWKTVKPIFSDKVAHEGLEKLIEGGKIVESKNEVSEIMNDYYSNVTNTLDIHNIPRESCDESQDSLENVISAFKNHPSVLRIRLMQNTSTKMEFKSVERDQLKKIILALKKKAAPEGDIPVSVLKQSIEAYLDTFSDVLQSSVNNCAFPDVLKLADVTPLHKTDSRFLKENYRPVSKLPAFSKVFERYMYDQIDNFISDKLSPLLSGFRKSYSTQLSLLHMIENWHRELDSGNFVAAILLDLSKAFDCINHDLLLAKLHAYGFSINALRMVKSYLSNRRQRVTLNGASSSWKDICIGVPQGSILGPLLFNIYINDLMFAFSDGVGICNYADDNTVFASSNDITEIKEKLEISMLSMSSWFSENGLQLNSSKCKLIVFGRNRENSLSVRIGNSILKECDEVKLLGIKLDNRLSFATHIDGLCKKGNAKLRALIRLSRYLSADKCKVLSHSFISSVSGYCPLIWSFANRTAMTGLERMNERANAVFSTEDSPPAKTLHRNHCEILLKEVFKTKNGLNPSYMHEVFPDRDISYSLRSGSSFYRHKTSTTKHGLQTASNIGIHLWDSLPENVKGSTSLKNFCASVSKLDSLKCTCRLCAVYVPNLGYLL